MKINKKVFVLLRYVFYTVLCAGMIVLLSFVDKKSASMKCKGVEVNIDEKVNHDFIDSKTVESLVNSRGNVTTKSIGSINTALLEKIILSNPFIESASVYSSIDGMLHADVTQRDPLIRIVTMKGEQFYIDKSGRFMPLSDSYTPDVPIANGYIFDTYSEMKLQEPAPVSDSAAVRPLYTLNQLYALATYISRDTFLLANTEQIYVNERQEMEIIPRLGSQRILIGDTTDMQDKFNRLIVFYKDGLSKTGWDKYSLINLKYKNQVVCSKSE